MIICKNASFGYEGQQVVSDLNFEINYGDYLCIVGENGSGKSTLIKGILGITPPMTGVLDIIVKKSEIGYLPQSSDLNGFFPASVNEIVMSGFCGKLGRRLFYTKAQKETAVNIMKKLNIDEFADNNISTLSGGQKQRVFLARALCAGTKLIIMDEPASSLDPIAATNLYSIIKEINQSGITVIMVSHDIKSATEYASHILHLGNKQLFFGTTEDYISNPYHNLMEGGKSDE